jgi:acetolactate synthase-1/2/3 large subunit
VCEFTPSAPLPKFEAPKVSDEAIAEAAKMISESKKPFIYCGGGVVISESSDEVLSLAKKIDAPIGTSMMGLSAIPSTYEGFLGMTGMHGRYAATRTMYSSDLIIAIGTRFSDRATGNKDKFANGAKVIHIDIDNAEINKNIKSNLSLVGEIKDVLGRIAPLISQASNPEWREEIKSFKEYEASQIVEKLPVNPKSVLETVRKFTKDETPVSTDVGQHQMWTTQFYSFNRPRKFISSGGLGTMGFGLGAAIGACVANDQKLTVMVTGDGSFHMNMNELATAASYDLPIKIILMNNNVLGMVRQWQTVFYNKHYSQTTLDKKTDYVALAKAMGGDGYVVQTLEELESACEKAFAEKGFSIIDCRIDSDEFVLPMIPPNGTFTDIITKKEED